MRSLSAFRALGLLSLLALAVGCGLIAGVKDRTLVEGSGGSTSSGSISTSTIATTSTSSSMGGQGGTMTTVGVTTGAGGGGGAGGEACPQQPPGVETIVCHQKRPTSLVIEGSSLFWANEDEGSIVTVSTSTSVNATPFTIVTGQEGICGIAVAKGYVYWRTSGGGVHRRSVTGDGLVQPVAELQGKSCAISASDTQIFWANAVNPANDVISAADLDDLSNVLDVVSTAEQVKRLDASQPPNLYWTAPDKGKVFRWNGANHTLSALPTGGKPCDVRTDGSHLFWTDTPINVVGTSNFDFKEATTVTTMTTQPCSLALHAPYAYWAEELGNGRVVRAQVGASAIVEVLADEQDVPCSIAVDIDGTRVFWTTCGGGEVLRRSVQPLPN